MKSSKPLDSSLSFKDLFSAIRPKTLFAGTSPVLLGLAYSLKDHHTISYLNFLNILLCTLLLQISSNLINDYYDGIKGVDSNFRIGPKRISNFGAKARKWLKISFATTLLLALLLGLRLMGIGGIPIIIIGFASLLFAYLYTGGPAPLSYLALGEILAFIFFGPIAVIGTIYLLQGPLTPASYLLGAFSGFFSASIMSINNLRDYQTDKHSAKNTLATIFGKKFASFLPLILISLALISIIIFSFLQNNYFFLLPLLIVIKFIPTWKITLELNANQKLNTVLAKTGQALFLISISFLLISVVTK